MTSSTDLGRIKSSEWELVNAHAEHLERAWREGGKSVDLRDFLPAADSPLHLAVLHELIKTDLEMRWRANRPGVLEDYLERFPELGEAPSLPPSLVYEEYRVRNLFGDHPALELYRQRFPAQFDRFEKILKVSPVPVPQPPPAPAAPHDTPTSVPLPTLPPSMAPPVVTPVGPPPLAGDQLLPSEGYVLGEELGHGEFGTVCRALAPGGVPVAVKRIHRPLSDKLSQRELKALELIRSLRHPFLLQTHNYWALKDRLIIVMELADGSVAQWLQQARAAGQDGLPAAEVLPYFLEAAEALDFLHEHNVMHRDVKPGNLLRLGGHAKVADFGLVRLQEDRLEQATMFGGTALYMPPEGWRNQVSVHSDQYSLAVTYAEVRLGRRIVSGKSLPDIMMEHLNGTPHLDGLPEAEKQVVRKALSKDPEARYPSCLAFVRALAAATCPPVQDKTPPSPSRRRVLTLVTALLVSVAGAVTGIVLRPSSPKLPPGCVKDDDPATAIEVVYNRRLYNRIRYDIPGAEPLRFVLMKPNENKDLLPFYFGTDKVTRGQFAAVLKNNPRMEELLQQFDRPREVGGQKLRPIKRKWAADLDDPTRAALPMTDVTPTEAHSFAVCVGGQLPTEDQWDKGMGRWNGVRDMPGNGLEWVANICSEGEVRLVPLGFPGPDDRVVRRGNPHNAPRPARFEPPEPCYRNAAYDTADDTGFRVVLTIPP
jgi:serine/threonine protein kinase